MKIIYTTSDGDYGALSFSNNHKGQTVSSIIERIESGEDLDVDNEDEEYTVEVMTFGDVDDLFVNFIRDTIQDYDDSKHQNFYLENETI